MDRNEQMITAFRANGGNVTEPMDFGRTLVLVHVVRKDGSVKVRPLRSVPDGGGWTVVGTAAGSPKHPAWVYGLRRMTQTDIEIPADPEPEIVHVDIEELTGAERDRVWQRFLEVSPGFADYEAKAQGRVFPIFRFTRA